MLCGNKEKLLLKVLALAHEGGLEKTVGKQERDPPVHSSTSMRLGIMEVERKVLLSPNP